jgi:hypothetical protein
MTRLLPTRPFYDPDQLVAWLLSEAATPENVEHLLFNCTSIDVGSDDLLRDRRECGGPMMKGPGWGWDRRSVLPIWQRRLTRSISS